MSDGSDGAPRPANLSQEASRLTSALHEIDELLTLNALLATQCALLADSLADALRFACHDPLTGLGNRRLLTDHFKQAAATARRKNNHVMLIFIDLDGFKGINDAIGHAAADRLLQTVAGRLSACVRASDTVCRYGGDEFVVLLPDIDHSEQALAVCGHIRSQVARHLIIDGTRIQATASLGMAEFPADGTDCNALIRSADQAMYRDKCRHASGGAMPTSATGQASAR